MALASSRVRRLEKEAIQRTKVEGNVLFSRWFFLNFFLYQDFEYKREKSSYLITNAYRDEEDDEADRHRRHEKMRQTRQIQREIDHQVNMFDKMTERRKQELEKKQNPPISLRNYSTSLSSSSNSSTSSSASFDDPERRFRTAVLMEKYSSKRINQPTTKTH